MQRTDPEFLSRVILYGLTRRAIYDRLKADQAAVADEGASALSVS
ncbi:MAG TPA: hypothetical protein VK858_18115 [Longimicrobiales bacterium]|nr:hypothetical protein [Longimicrobiales bacterium]